jgi:hypothetical protein
MEGSKFLESSKFKSYFHHKLYLIIILLGYSLSLAIPIYSMPGAGHDDGLFFNLATTIAQNQWLGPFYNLTLAKGPAYPVFLATLFHTPIPYPIALYSLYLLGITSLTHALKPLLRPAPHLLLFSLLALNPAYFALNRITRDSFYACLFLIATGITLQLFLASRLRPLPSASLGACLALLYCCREDAILELSFLSLPLLLLIWKHRSDRPLSPFHQKFRQLFRQLFIPLISSFILIYLYFALSNLNHYGYFGITDNASGWFPKFYGQLTAIQDPKPIDYIPISKAGRKRAYAISPSFRQLKRPLEGKLRRNWAGPQSFACQAYPSTCGDFAGGWLLWALRDAVANQQAYATANTAQAFYKQTYQELKQACQQRLVPCDRPTGFIDLDSFDRDRFSRSFLKGIQQLLTLQAGEPLYHFTPDYSGTPAQLQEWSSKLNATLTGTPTIPNHPNNFRLAKISFTTLAHLYAIAIPLLFLTAFVLTVLNLNRQNLQPLSLIKLWILSHLLTKLILLSFIDSTSFPGIYNLYMIIPFTETLILAVIGLVQPSPGSTPSDRNCSSSFSERDRKFGILEETHP